MVAIDRAKGCDHSEQQCGDTAHLPLFFFFKTGLMFNVAEQQTFDLRVPTGMVLSLKWGSSH